MWPDPTNLSKGKPRYLGGTPSNLASCYWSLACGSIIIAGYTIISYTSWFQKKIVACKESTDEFQANTDVRAFMNNPVVKLALARKRKEYENN